MVELLIVLLGVFTFGTVVAVFLFSGYVLKIVIGDIRKDLPEQVPGYDSFLPISQAPPEKLDEFMRSRDIFTEGKTLDLVRDGTVSEQDDVPFTDPGENSIM
jgi:hypothetical protein